MRCWFLIKPYAAALLICALAAPLRAAPFQLVSGIDYSQPAPAGGSGDSFAPVISPDGRYVLFASSANNLVLKTNGNPFPALALPRLNVFLRDLISGTTTLVSVNLSGAGGGNGDSIPAGLSTNGHYALFESSATDLVPGDTNGVADIFVRDLVAGTTFLVSTNSSGESANGVSRESVMTPDGRYVAFVSAATNLVAGDTNQIPDVFVRDLQAGTTILVSAGATSTSASVPGGSSESPEITPDGRYVAFFSTATNLVPGTNQMGDIYVRDVVGGTTVWASTNARTMFFGNNAANALLNVISYNHAISADGSIVAFETSTNPPGSRLGRGIILRFNLATGLTDLVNANANVATAPYAEIHSLAMTPDGRFIAFVANTNGGVFLGATTCVELWDGQSGTTSLASGNLSNDVPAGSTCDWPAIDPSGRYVAFLSSSTNMVTNSLAGDYHLYVRDMQAGAARLVAADPTGIGSPLSPATAPAMSDDGRFVAFECLDAGLVPNDRNRDYDVFLRDLTTDPVELVSAHDPALPSLSPNGPSSFSLSSVSRDGRLVAFASEADNLAPNDTNGCRDVFVHDRLSGTNVLVSVATNGAAGDGTSTDSTLSGNLRYVAFTSSADNLVAGDTNRAQDVFVRDLQTRTTTLVSVGANGGVGNSRSYSPVISADGRFVMFRSLANNLVAGIPFTTENLFVRNLQSGITYGLTTNGVACSAMTPDGSPVGFAPLSSTVFREYVWDSQAANLIYTNTSASLALFMAFRPDGSWLVYATSGQLQAIDLVSRTTTLLASAYLGVRSGLQFNGDGRFLTYAATATYAGTSNQVYLYDFQTRTNLLISRNFVAQGGLITNSDSPVISADGRFIAYRSTATDPVVSDANGAPDIFLYDRLTATTMLLTTSRLGNIAADNRSLTPVFSGDGRTLFFESWASDLTPADFNHQADLFAYPFLYASILRATGPGQGPQITWPATPGTTYSVQYKNTLSDPAWQNVAGAVTILNDQGYLTDLAPGDGTRFYRVVGF